MDSWSSESEKGNKDSSDDETRNFDDIREYFLPNEFAELSDIEKRAYQVQKERYDEVQEAMLTSKGNFPNIQAPAFMQAYSLRQLNARKRKESNQRDQGQLKRRKNDSQVTPASLRKSSRLMKQVEDENLSHLSIDDPTSDANDGESFPGLKPYFTPSEWGKLSIVAKGHFQAAMDTHNNAISAGIPCEPPKFMTRSGRETATASTSTQSLQMINAPSGNSSLDQLGHGVDKNSTDVRPSRVFGNNSSFVESGKLTRKKVVSSKTNQQTYQKHDQNDQGHLLDTSSSFNFEGPAESEDQLGAQSIESMNSQSGNDSQDQFGRFGHGMDNNLTPVRQPLREISNNAIVNTSNLMPRKRFVVPTKTNAQTHQEDQEHSLSPSFNSDQEGSTGSENLMTIQPGSETSITNLNDLKLLIRTLVKSALPNISKEIPSQIADTIIDCGADSDQDLVHVKEEMLAQFGLKSIQISKIMTAFKNHTDKTKGKPKQKKKDELMRPESTGATVAISSRPLLAQKRLQVGTMGGFIVDFSKFRDSFLRNLEKGERPSSTDRENFIFVLSVDILNKYLELKALNPTIKQLSPGRPVYKKVVAEIFKNTNHAASLEDRLNGKVVGDGMFSSIDSIETCIENQNRPKRVASERPGRVKGNRAAACILEEKYAPSLTKQQRSEGEQIRKNLLAVYKSPKTEWDWEEIKKLLVEYSSLACQRALITAKNRYMDEVVEKWPFLFELNGLLCHLNNITNSQLQDNFEKFIDTELDNLIEFLTVMSPVRIQLIKLQNEVALGDGIHRRFLSAIYMLAMHWGDDPALLFSSVEASTMAHEVVDILGEKLPSTPHIVARGTSPFEAKTFYLFMDSVCLFHNLTSGLEAVMALCASFFVFGVLYPSKASNILLYIERFVANLTDASGMLKTSTQRGGQAIAPVNKLKTLEDDMEKFEREMRERITI